MMKRFLSMLLLAIIAFPLIAQNPDFDATYQAAKKLLDQKQYERAKKQIDYALTLPFLSEAQKSKAAVLRGQCNTALEIGNRLNLAYESLIVDYRSGLDSVGYDAGKPQLLDITSSDPSWCKLEGRSAEYFYVKTEANPTKKERTATITVKMGRGKSATLTVVQPARPDTRKRLIIHTVPDRAVVTVDGFEPVTGVWDNVLVSKDYHVKVKKDGYEVFETDISVLDDLKDEEVMEYTLELVPEFAKIRLEVLPEEGFSFGHSQPSIKLNDNFYERPREEYSYDADREIRKYHLYNDGTIPVSIGSLDIEVAATNFETQRFSVQVRNGDVVPVTCTLKAITGYLTLDYNAEAEGATVYIDSVAVGTVDEFKNKRTLVGAHSLTLEKEGFRPGNNEYPINIQENISYSESVKMFHYKPYVFTSSPTGARVTVDGEFVGMTPTPPVELIEHESGAPFVIEVSKENYLTMTRELRPDFSNYEQQTESFGLLDTQICSFEVSDNESGLTLTISNPEKGDTVFVKNVALPADVSLPVRKKPYLIDVRRAGQSQSAYKKKFTFDATDKSPMTIHAYTNRLCQFIGANYYLTGMPASTIGDKEFKNLGNVSLMKFRIFSGLSTALIRGGFYMGANEQIGINATKQDGSALVCKEGNYNYLPAISVVLLNWDVRVGAYVSDFCQVNAVASYAWYPDIIKKFTGFSHMVGHDIFVGAEVSSCIRIINANIKAGIQMYPGLKANIYDSRLASSSSSKEQKYATLPVAGLPSAMFVVSVGFALSSSGSRGEGIFRLGHWF